jgi:hypothetical protein
MNQTSAWLSVDDVFEINEEGVLKLLYKAIKLLQLYNIQNSMKFEKERITQAIQNFQDDLIVLNISESYLSGDECEVLMARVYRVIKNIIDLVEIDLFD